jgi:hypothetical protein
MTILFPNHPLKSLLPDPDYESEHAAAKAAGLHCEVFNLESLREGDLTAALRTCAAARSEQEPLVHRCWMMSDALFSNLHGGLVAQGYRPITSAAQYAEAHYMPIGYRHLAPRTPETRWITGKNEEDAWELYQPFADRDCIIKDWVKSAKHRWREACLIPASTSRERFSEIFKAFLEARGNLFEKGVVLRRYHDLVRLEEDLRGQPVHEEYRMFFWRAKLLAATPAIRGEGPFGSLGEWEEVASRFSSPFITMDVARETSGNWLIIEVGDGGVSGLPFSIEADAFYQALFERTSA